MRSAPLVGEPDRLTLPNSPYKGFEPYSEDDWAIFFGRERERKVVTANLRSSRLTLLYGASGVGKTSLLRAGVVHDLRERGHADARAGRDLPFAVVYFAEWSDWSHDPVAGILETARSVVADLRGGSAPEPEHNSLRDHLAAYAAPVGVLLVILDQFESYFVYNPRETEDDRLAAELPGVVNTPALHVNVLVSVREDALASLDRFKGRIPRLFDNYLRLGHLEVDAARDAIRRPIERYNKSLSPEEKPFAVDEDLVEAVVAGVRTDALAIGQSGLGRAAADDGHASDASIETAYLQLVMEKLWEAERNDPAQRLRKETLERLGGPQKIALTHVRDKLDGLPADEQPLATKIFDRLVTPSGTKIAQRDADLSEWAGASPERVGRLLERLCAQDVRILRQVPSPDESTDSRHELFHDVLVSGILEWSRRYDERRQRDEAERQELRRRDEERKAQQARIFRRVAFVLALAVVGMAVLARFAFSERDRAKRQTEAANANLLDARALSALATAPDRARGYALEALQAADTPLAEDALSAVLFKSRPLAKGSPVKGKPLLLSPDGNRLFGTAPSPTVWQVHPPRFLASLETLGRRAVVKGASFSADGRLIVTVGPTERGTSARVWRAATGRPIGRVLKLEAVIKTAVTSSDAYWVVTMTDRRAQLWKTSAARPVATVSAPPNDSPVFAAAFAPDSRLFATGSGDGTVRIWRLQPAPRVLRILKGHGGKPEVVAFSRDSKLLVTAGDAGMTRIWSVDSGRELAVFRGHGSPVISAAFDRSGSRVITQGADGAVRIWTWRRPGGERVVLADGGARIVSAAFTAKGDVVTANAAGLVALWPVRPAKTVLSNGPSEPVISSAFSPDGRLFAVAHPRTIGALETNTGRRLDSFPLSPVVPFGVAVSPNGNLAYSGSYNGIPHVWEVGSSGKPKVLPTGSTSGRPINVAFSPDGTILAAPADNGTTLVWELGQTATQPYALGSSGDGTTAASFSSDGDLLVTAGRRVVIWRISSRESLSSVGPPAKSAAFSPDAESVVTVGFDGTARIIRWRDDAQSTIVLRGHGGGVSSAAFSPSGTVVVTGGQDGVARLWGAESGLSIGVIYRGKGPITGAAFKPDGRHVLLARQNGSVVVYTCEVCGSRNELLHLARPVVMPGRD